MAYTSSGINDACCQGISILEKQKRWLCSYLHHARRVVLIAMYRDKAAFLTQKAGSSPAIFAALIDISWLIYNVQNTVLVMTEVGSIHRFVGSTSKEVVEL